MLLADTETEVLPEVDTIFGEYCPLGQAKDDALLIIFNAHQSDIDYALPQLNGDWQILLNTATPLEQADIKQQTINTNITALAHSCVVLSFSKINNNPLTLVREERE